MVELRAIAMAARSAEVKRRGEERDSNNVNVRTATAAR